MNIIEILKSRYSAKEFDPSKKLPNEVLIQIEELLQLAPSSTNIQPWHFVMATTEEGKQKIAKSTQGFFSFNEQKVLDASAVVVFATKTEINEDYHNQLINKEDADGRYPQVEFKNIVYGGRKVFADMHQNDLKDQLHWLEKQVYLNVGNFLLGLAALDIDAVPMEGFNKQLLDEELGLSDKGFTSSIIVPIGYRSTNDFNAKAPKSRLAIDDLVTRI